MNLRPALQQFIERRSMPVTECGCWIWLGTLNPKGYGIVKFADETFRAHRLSWLVHRGEIPNSLFVLHQCDTPSCVNPDHLFLGDHRENMRDMARKGRSAGAKNGRCAPAPAKLSVDQVQLVLRSNASNRELAHKFKVAKNTIGDIRRGRTWRTVVPPSRGASHVTS